MTKVHKLKKLTKIKVMIRPDFLYLLIYKPSYCTFPESRKKNYIIFVLFYPPTLCLIEEKNIFEALYVYFESDTVKSDCPIQIFRKIMNIYKDLILTVGMPHKFNCFFFLEILKNSSENEKKKL